MYGNGNGNSMSRMTTPLGGLRNGGPLDGPRRGGGGGEDQDQDQQRRAERNRPLSDAHKEKRRKLEQLARTRADDVGGTR